MADVNLSSAAFANIQQSAGLGGPFWVSTVIGYGFVQGGSDAQRGTVDIYKTSDGGDSWGLVDTIDPASNNFTHWAFWADFQTPGDLGNLIHAVTIRDLGASSEIYYYSFDPDTDQFSSPTTIATGLNGAVNSEQDFDISMAKAVSGRFLVAGKDDGDSSFAYFADDPTGSWTSCAAPPYGNDETADTCKLYPANLADPDDMWGLFSDASAAQLLLATFDASGDSWSTVVIGACVGEGTSYKAQYDGAVRHSDGHLLVVAWSELDTVTADLASWDITDAATITAKADLISNKDDAANVSILIEPDTEAVDVVYIGSDTGLESLLSTVGVYYKRSTDGMASWGSEQTYGATTDDYRYVTAGAVMPLGGGRFQPLVFNEDLADAFVNNSNDFPIAAVVPLSITAGPTVSYPSGLNHTGPDAPTWVLTWTATIGSPETYTWEIWTGPGQTGTMVASGTDTSDSSVSRAIAWDADGLSLGTRTLYLFVDTIPTGSDDEASFEVTIELPPDIPLPETEEEGFTGQFGPVVVRFRYERRTRDFAFLAALIGVVVDAEVRLDNFRPVPMDVTLTILPDLLPADWKDAQEYISITREFLVGGEFVPYTVGLFRLSVPVADHRPNGDEVWKVTGFDLAGELVDVKIGEATTYSSGTNIVTAVRGLLDTYGYRHAFDDSAVTLTSDVPFPPGTSVLDIVNKLLEAMNFQATFPDEFGIFRTKERLDPAATPYVIKYSTEHEPRFIVPPWRPTFRALDQPNRVAVITEDPAQAAPIAATARRNADPRSKMGTEVRGYEDPIDIDGAHVVSETVKAELADWYLQVAAAHAVTAELHTTMDPRRRNHEVYLLEIEDHEVNTRWLVFGWTMALEPGGLMKHSLGRADPLELEDV